MMTLEAAKESAKEDGMDVDHWLQYMIQQAGFHGDQDAEDHLRNLLEQLEE